MFEILRRPQRATLAEIAEVTGWQPLLASAGSGEDVYQGNVVLRATATSISGSPTAHERWPTSRLRLKAKSVLKAGPPAPASPFFRRRPNHLGLLLGLEPSRQGNPA